MTESAPPDDPASEIFSMVGMLYAVLLAFVVIVVWEFSSAVGDDAQAEANDVSQIYFTARALPEPQRGHMMALASDYATTVAYREWPAMRRGQTDGQARSQVAQMRVEIMSLRPADGQQEILMTQTLDAINALVDARRARTRAIESPVPPIMWAGLVGGAAVTVGLTLLLGSVRSGRALLLTSGMAALLMFTLWLIYEMSHPFSGPTGHGPDAFLAILARFEEFS
jgi:hypothetical protein